uniref:small monomeric GTPase n=1 Tax=Hucho hucho TaxID=62062 RepID=A0A4W5RA24_9TELE
MAKSPEVKLAVFGRAGVGKSALVVRFLTRRFIWEYDPTLESTYRHQATIDDEVVTMEILDTAGQVGASATLNKAFEFITNTCSQ